MVSQIGFLRSGYFGSEMTVIIFVRRGFVWILSPVYGVRLFGFLQPATQSEPSLVFLGWPLSGLSDLE